MAYMLRSARFLSHDVLKEAVQKGDTVIDATMGNGHDTLFLCELVGEEGKVIAFDVQAQAVESTRRRLMENGMLGRASLYHMGHERMEEAGAQDVSAIVFNLGWLPGGDKSVTTLWETTKVALEKALSLLRVVLSRVFSHFFTKGILLTSLMQKDTYFGNSTFNSHTEATKSKGTPLSDRFA